MAKTIFNFETETIATLTSLEGVINTNKSISSDAVAMVKNAKLDQYSIMVHTVHNEILNNANSKLTKTTKGKIEKVLHDDVGMNDATIKRLLENAVNLCRKSKSKNEKRNQGSNGNKKRNHPPKNALIQATGINA